MVQIARYSFTVDEYNRMGAAGIFPDGVRTELIEGEIVEMAPIGSHHLSTVIALSELFIRALTCPCRGLLNFPTAVNQSRTFWFSRGEQTGIGSIFQVRVTCTCLSK
jgi:hypothetical protein